MGPGEGSVGLVETRLEPERDELDRGELNLEGLVAIRTSRKYRPRHDTMEPIFRVEQAPPLCWEILSFSR